MPNIEFIYLRKLLRPHIVVIDAMPGLTRKPREIPYSIPSRKVFNSSSRFVSSYHARAKLPVCNSTHGDRISADASSCLRSGSINILVGIPASVKALTASLDLSKLDAISSPPSVVTSFRFSGTRQTLSGLKEKGQFHHLGSKGNFQIQTGLHFFPDSAEHPPLAHAYGLPAHAWLYRPRRLPPPTKQDLPDRVQQILHA